jgi:hypothetical protein
MIWLKRLDRTGGMGLRRGNGSNLASVCSVLLCRTKYNSKIWMCVHKTDHFYLEKLPCEDRSSVNLEKHQSEIILILVSTAYMVFHRLRALEHSSCSKVSALCIICKRDSKLSRISVACIPYFAQSAYNTRLNEDLLTQTRPCSRL